MRITRVLRNVKGRYSSMLDMGGVASAKSNTKIDLGKNNKIRAIALDFNLITKSFEEHKKETAAAEAEGKISSSNNLTKASNFTNENANAPRKDLVEKMADLLGVKLPGGAGGEQKHSRKSAQEGEDDLSRLMGDGNRSKKSIEQASTKNNIAGVHTLDVRAKYASKLRAKADGGLSIQGIDLANSKKEEALQRGDAAGHFLARSIAASSSNLVSTSTSGSKWIATTGSGSLLSFLSTRSVKIALMPSSRIMREDEKIKMKEDMESLTRQLPTIKFDLLLDGESTSSSAGGNDVAASLLSKVRSIVDIDPMSTLVVSDQDNYLRSARDMGCFTCRVRKKNAPRGNITTNYNAEDMSGVQDVVNELNGISFNAVVSSPR